MVKEIQTHETVGDRLRQEVEANPDSIGTRLQLAEYYNSQGDTDRLFEAVAPLAEQYPLDTESQSFRYNRIMAFGHIRSGRIAEAEAFVDAGLAQMPNSPDLHYAMAFIKTSLREHQEAIQAALRYLETFDGADDSCLATSDQHRAQLLNFLATAYREAGNFEEARLAFEDSIAADPGNHLPYLNLANMHVQKAQWDEAETVIDRGLENCRQIHELRLLKKNYSRRASISACLIVKNEEEMLEGCLQSIRDWVDEIVVVDTGSTDRTIEIAESFGAKIFHQAWEGDFSKARNYSLEQATGEWILIIDADERIVEDDVPQLLQVVNEGEHPFISINVLNIYGKDERTMTFLPSERLFKRELNLRYKGIVHNQLDVPQGMRALRTSVRLKHYGYGLEPEKMRKKLARSRALLEKQLEENPDNAFAHFNLAQLLRAGEDGFPVENAPEIIAHAKRGVELTDPEKSRERHIHLMCLDQLAWTYFYTERFDESQKCCERALAIKSDYLDPLLLRGHIEARQKRYAEAIPLYEKYLEVQAGYDPGKELSNVILFHVDSRANALYALGMCYLATGNKEKAKACYEKVIKLDPGYLEANSHLGRIYLESGEVERARRLFLAQFEHGEHSHEAALGLAAIYRDEDNLPEAEKYYRIAIDLKPDDPVAKTKLESMLSGEEATPRNSDSAGEGRADRDLTEADIEQAERLFAAGRFADARAAYQRVIDAGRGDSAVYNDYGNCCFKLEQYEDAEKYYRRALEADEPLDLAYRNLGVVLIRLNRPKEAILALKQYSEVNPEDDAVIAQIGSLNAQQGEYSAAIGRFEEYLTRNPHDAMVLFQLSECYERQGHEESALMGYRRVLALEPNFTQARERVERLSATVQPIS